MTIFNLARPLLFSLVLLFVGACSGSTTGTPACEPGAAACACKSDGSCGSGLSCVANVCVKPAASGVVLPAGARGCEFVLAESGGQVTDIKFSAGVRGTFVREAPRTAVSVVRSADSDFAAGDVALVTSGNPTLSLSSASCVDKSGARLASATVVLR